MDKLLTVSSSPHIRSSRTVSGIMLDVIIALMPATVAAVVLFGARAAAVVAVCVITAVVSEFLYQKITKSAVLVGDLSACVTGLLLALNLPATVPLWQAAIGSVFAIVVVKCLFGGIGKNFANPAMTARIMMIISFSDSMTSFPSPDLNASSTPLAIMKDGMEGLPKITDMLLGRHGGSMGETCSVAILLGGIYLLCRRVINGATPLCFIGTVAAISFVYGGAEYALYQVLSGGLMLGAFFMATDYSTTPTRKAGKIIFGMGCGIITSIIRIYGSYPEGVSYAILLMNILTPYIDKWTRPVPFGGKTK